MSSKYDDLEKLADLKNMGIITEEEFIKKKKEILEINENQKTLNKTDSRIAESHQATSQSININTRLQPRSFLGTATMIFGVTALPFALGTALLMSLESEESFGKLLVVTIPVGLIFGILFDLAMAVFFKGVTITVNFSNREKFVALINVAISQIGYNPTTSSINFLNFKPSFSAGLMTGKTSVILESNKATIIGPSIYINKLKRHMA